MRGTAFAILMVLTLGLTAPAPAKTVPPVPLPPAPGTPAPFDPAKLTDKDRCHLMSGAAERANARLPMTVGTIRAEHIAIDCGKRSFQTFYAVATAIAAVPPGWRESIERSLSSTVCSGELTGPMAAHGWQFTSTYRFAGGEILTMRAQCQSARDG